MPTITMEILPEESFGCGIPAIADGDEFDAYLKGVIDTIGAAEAVLPVPCSRADVGDRIFERITRKPYCYLSRKRSTSYRNCFVDHANAFAERAEPVRLFYDIGAGYHASLDPDSEPLSFSPGLGELLILYQIAKLNREVKAFYAPGVRFTFVIDNLLAHFVNDIPIDRTLGYCRKLRRMIRETGMGHRVDLLVESEICESEVYAALIGPQCPETTEEMDVSAAEQRNVSRFLGYPCSREEAAARMQRYRRVTPVSDRVINAKVDSVRMTQRATPATLAFRPFPGGDSRIQAGEVALCRNRSGKVRPVLLTSENVVRFDYNVVLEFDKLPSSLSEVRIVAERPAKTT